jgi:hypothetical protein
MRSDRRDQLIAARLADDQIFNLYDSVGITYHATMNLIRLFNRHDGVFERKKRIIIILEYTPNCIMYIPNFVQICPTVIELNHTDRRNSPQCVLR